MAGACRWQWDRSPCNLPEGLLPVSIRYNTIHKVCAATSPVLLSVLPVHVNCRMGSCPVLRPLLLGLNFLCHHLHHITSHPPVPRRRSLASVAVSLRAMSESEAYIRSLSLLDGCLGGTKRPSRLNQPCFPHQETGLAPFILNDRETLHLQHGLGTRVDMCTEHAPQMHGDHIKVLALSCVRTSIGLPLSSRRSVLTVRGP